MLRVLILVVALAAGGGAAWFAAQTSASEAVADAPAPPTPVADMTAVLVAAQDFTRGEQTAPGTLIWQQWPAGAVPVNSIDRRARPEADRELAGHFASRQISQGELITDLALAAQPQGFLAAMLGPENRAVAINVNAQSTAGGFILPNDRVDVLHTLEGSRDREGSGAITRTILRSVRVLAVDQTTEDTESGTVVGKTATLELTEAQVEAVTAAEASGALSLSLRPLLASPGQTSMVVTTPAKTIRVRRANVIEDVVIN